MQKQCQGRGKSCIGGGGGDTYKYIILYPYHVAPSQVGWGKRRYKQLLRLPIIRLSSSDLSPGYGRKFPRFRLHHFVLGDVLNGLERALCLLTIYSLNDVSLILALFTYLYTVIRKPMMRSSLKLTSVSEPLVPLMVTLLWLSMVAQMLIASPGT